MSNPGLGYGEILQSRTFISSAKLKDLVAHPVTLVPAPGVGKVIWPIQILEDYKYGSVDYVATGSPFFFIGLNITPDIWYSRSEDLLRNYTSSSLNVILPISDDFNPADSRANSENRPLILGGNSTDLTDGDGTLTVTVLFQIIDLQRTNAEAGA